MIFLRRVIVVFSLFLWTGNVGAEWGMPPATVDGIQNPAVKVEDIKPALAFKQARYDTGGVALRNQQYGTITIGSIPPDSKVVKAYLYWMWASMAAPVGGLHDQVLFKRISPTLMPGGLLMATMVGVSVGSGLDPCWLGSSNYVYRADVTALVAGAGLSGGGVYLVGLKPGSAGSFDRSDPWGPPGAVAPLAEGASLVVIYQNGTEAMGTVRLYDVGLAGNMFMDVLDYNLVGLPAGGTLSLWDTIGGDGQVGSSRLAIPLAATETTTLDLVPVAGPVVPGGSTYNDSNWNGSDGRPLPQLWDTHGHRVDLPIGAAGSVAVNFTAGWDCLVPAANVTLTFP
ncbi:MAG: hypothetical protein HY760_02720 [Nitrospirae bacterium]|nr:hypothetical protein [Nitrospirota bacterium]